MRVCRGCGSQSLDVILDGGMHPVSNRYVGAHGASEHLHPLRVGLCSICGLVQLIDPVSSQDLVPRYDWVSYKEPEAHLHALAQTIGQLPGLPKNPTACGISVNDDPLLRFLERGGFTTARVDLRLHLGISTPGAGVETIQHCLTADSARAFAQTHGHQDVVVARQILEHVHDIPQFMAAVSALAKPNGYVVFEVPDNTRVLETFNYSALWEEHLFYFTPATFQSCLDRWGFSPLGYTSYPYPYVDSLVAIVPSRRGAVGSPPSVPASVLEAEILRAKAFGGEFSHWQCVWRSYLTECRQAHGKVAMFGAGHLAIVFINLMDLGDVIDLVVDDNPNKKGLLMPGSQLPIVGTEVLGKGEVHLCLTSLNPESEERVIQGHQAFRDQGGSFVSIFPASKHALSLWGYT